MTNFMDELKNLLIQNIPQHACEYYHTALQHQDKLQELMDLCENNEFYLDFRTPEDSEYSRYYSEGEIYIWLEEHQEFSYKIHLGWNERHWGYCQCEPTDKFYNPKYKCCGMGCDATFAEITLTKSKSSIFSFVGQKRDLWVLQAEWDGQGKDEYEQKLNEAKVESINQQIEELIKARDYLLHKDE